MTSDPADAGDIEVDGTCYRAGATIRRVKEGE